MTTLSMMFVSDYMGEDEFENMYYEDQKPDFYGCKKRYVLYAPDLNIDSIPPLYHGWLHHTIEKFPESIKKYQWQKEHNPYNYFFSSVYNPVVRKDAKKPYQKYSSWLPEM